VADVIDAVVQAISGRDLNAFIACYAVDARIEDAEGTPLATDHGELRLRYEEMFRRFPDLRVRALARLTVGTYVVQEEEVLGRAAQPERHIAIYRLAREGLIAHERLLK